MQISEISQSNNNNDNNNNLDEDEDIKIDSKTEDTPGKCTKFVIQLFEIVQQMKPHAVKLIFSFFSCFCQINYLFFMMVRYYI